MTLQRSINKILVFIFIAFSALSYFLLRVAGKDQPDGELICKQPDVRWQSPAIDGAAINKHTVEWAEATFKLENTGGKPVHITSTESGCGCTKPRVNPMTISPGAVGSVYIEATPFLIGEKTTQIIIHTDSKITPSIFLRLHMIGGRKPPLILKSSGGTSIDVGPDGVQDGGMFTITTLQAKDEAENILPTANPNVQFTLLDTEIKPYAIDGLIYKAYNFKTNYNINNMYDKHVVEDITIQDPWDDMYKVVLPLHITRRDIFRAIPPSLLYRVTDKRDSETQNSFIILINKNYKIDKNDLLISAVGFSVIWDVTEQGDRIKGTIALAEGDKERAQELTLKSKTTDKALFRMPIRVIIE